MCFGKLKDREGLESILIGQLKVLHCQNELDKITAGDYDPLLGLP